MCLFFYLVFKRSMTSRKKKSSMVYNPQACIFCGTEENNEFLYGNFFHFNDMSVHQNCMFFSSGLSQHGQDEAEGVLGFLFKDIKQEMLRCKKLRCFYCKKYGASIGCCKNACQRKFHFPCAVKNKSLHQFFGTFSSFCQSHKPIQKRIATSKAMFNCSICFLSLSKTSREDCLYAPCCSSKWFHRACLQKYALSAGSYFFKCPLCNDSTTFIQEMLEFGIYIPEKDASWELEENAFQELLSRPECGAETCHCKKGRKHNGKGVWCLLSCTVCGSQARHRYCENLKTYVKSWKCNDCQVLEDNIQKNNQVYQESLKDKNHENSVLALDQSNKILKQSYQSSSSSSSAITSNLKSIVECVVKVTPMKEADIKKATMSLHAHNESTDVKRKLTQELDLSSKKVCNIDLTSIKTDKTANKNNLLILALKPTSLKTFDSGEYSLAKVTKKRKKVKKFSSGCCSGHPQRCIKVMFGLECCNYRL